MLGHLSPCGHGGYRHAAASGVSDWCLQDLSLDRRARAGDNLASLVPNGQVPRPSPSPIPFWDEASWTGTIAQRKAALASTERAQRQGLKSDKSLHHRQPGAFHRDCSQPIDAACRCLQRYTIQKCRRTDHGTLLNSKWVSMLPFLRLRPSAQLVRMLHPRHPSTSQTVVIGSLQLSHLPVLLEPFPPLAWALARVAAGPRDSPVLHVPIHLTPTRRRPPFHFVFLIRLRLFHKQEGSCKRP